jgi:hypothetical protein
VNTWLKKTNYRLREEVNIYWFLKIISKEGRVDDIAKAGNRED